MSFQSIEGFLKCDFCQKLVPCLSCKPLEFKMHFGELINVLK